MKISTRLRRGANYMRTHGYHHTSNCRTHGPRCFIFSMPLKGAEPTYEYLRNVIFGGDFGWFYSNYLETQEWNADDAIAALDIAADIAEREGR